MPSPAITFRLAFLPLLVLLAGCGSRPAAPTETWDVLTIKGSKVGYAHSIRRTAAYQGKSRVETTSTVRMEAVRYGDASRLEVATTCWEEPDGRFVGFDCRMLLGAKPQRIVGRVDRDRLVLTDMTTSELAAGSLPWEADYGGFDAVEESLRRQPLKPGERRSVRSLIPVLNQLGTTELVAHDNENTALQHGSARLLRVGCQLRIGRSPPLDSVLWIDEAGETLKLLNPGMEQVTYRSTRDEALAPVTSTGLDLGLATSVPLNRAIADPHRKRSIVYRITMTDGDPSELIPSGPYQHVESQGPHVAVVRVEASAIPTAPGPTPAADTTPPTVDDQQATPLVQSDDPTIRQLSSQAVGDVSDPWQKCLRIESFVHRQVKSKNFSQAFASAAEVAKSLEGDCTEHAVLLAALARAQNIPARVAIGLVYTPQPALAFHMWSEVFVAGQWRPLDATLGQGGIGPTHIKLGQSSLGAADAFAGFLPVAQILGRLKIEIVASGN